MAHSNNSSEELSDYLSACAEKFLTSGMSFNRSYEDGRYLALIASDVGQAFEKFQDGCAHSCGVSRNPLLILFRSIVTSLIESGEFSLSEKLAEAHELGIDNSEVRWIIDEINRSYILDSELEITSHGLLRSFRFWGVGEKISYLNHARDLIGELVLRYGDACLAYGAVLSYVRNQDLSPHDDDLDVIVGMDMAQFPTFTNAIDHLCSFLSENGYQIVGRWPAFVKVRKPEMEHDIDLFIGLKEQDMLSAIPGPRHAIYWADIFPAATSVFYGVTLPIPARAEAYLEKVYGQSWRVPQSGWQHRWDYAAYADIT